MDSGHALDLIHHKVAQAQCEKSEGHPDYCVALAEAADMIEDYLELKGLKVKEVLANKPAHQEQAEHHPYHVPYSRYPGYASTDLSLIHI